MEIGKYSTYVRSIKVGLGSWILGLESCVLDLGSRDCRFLALELTVTTQEEHGIYTHKATDRIPEGSTK